MNKLREARFLELMSGAVAGLVAMGGVSAPSSVSVVSGPISLVD